MSMYRATTSEAEPSAVVPQTLPRTNRPSRPAMWNVVGGRAVKLLERSETIRFLVSSHLKAGHRDKAMGHLWSLLDPLLFIGVYFLVFGVLFGQTNRSRGTFIVYLSIGVLAWRFFDGAVSQCTSSIKGNRGLIHEINFPKSVFPVATVLWRLYDFCWGLLVLLPIVLLCGVKLTANVFWIVPLVGLHVVFTIGIGFMVAFLGAFFADTSNIVSVILRVMMYLSPTFYYARGSKSIIPERYLSMYMLNPIACFFESYRDVILWGHPPDRGMVLYAAAISIVVLVVGFTIFALGEGKFAKYV